MARYYSDEIIRLVNKETVNLVIPDLVLIKEGISCGDRLIMRGQVDDMILRFDIVSKDSCMLCRAASADVIERFNATNIEYINRTVRQEINKYEADKHKIFARYGLSEEVYGNRYECLILPYKLLLTFINELKNKNIEYGFKPDTSESMECDACVSSCNINWENKEKRRIDHRGDKKYGSDYLSKWLPLGKIELLDDDKKLLRKMCESITESDLQFLSDYTMNSFVLHHLMEYAPDLINEKWKPAAYLIQKNEINKSYFEEIKRYIIDNGLNIYFVKGYVSQKYYQNPALRIHSDYDVIAESCMDAFKLANYLMNNGFSIRPNLFSYKPIIQNGKIVVSGHFHVQRIIDDTYMLEIDISFPGFPLNRVHLFYPRVVANAICVEDQIVVTLLHLFKHSNVYMKDINDLYYMFQENLDIEYLSNRLKEYGIEQYFKLAVNYVINNYPGAKEKLNHVINSCDGIDDIGNNYVGWPYDETVHRRIKVNDYNLRGGQEIEQERKYLYPVIIFKNLYYFDKNEVLEEAGYEITNIDQGIITVRYKEYVVHLTAIGILIDSYIDTKNVTRLGYVDFVKEIINCLGIHYSMIQDVPFATEHFYVRNI